eukprot:1158225-Pelagomonas_calceolata.AAC.15
MEPARGDDNDQYFDEYDDDDVDGDDEHGDGGDDVAMAVEASHFPDLLKPHMLHTGLQGYRKERPSVKTCDC